MWLDKMRGLGLSRLRDADASYKKVTIVYAIVNNTIEILYVWNNQQDPNRLGMVLGVE